MVSGISFQNCCAKFGQSIQKKQLGQGGQPPAEFLNKLKDAGVPDDIIAKGKAAVESFAKEKNIALPTPPEPPAGDKSQGIGFGHLKKGGLKDATTGDQLKSVMEKNNIPYTGNLKDDIAAIKSAIKALDKDEATALKTKLGLAGLDTAKVDDKEATKKAFQGQDQLADFNKHFLVKNSHKKA